MALKTSKSKSLEAKPTRSQRKVKLYLHHHNGGTRPSIRRNYHSTFKLSPQYYASLPDMMHAEQAIQGAQVPIPQVGVSNFKLPLKFARAQRGSITLEAAVFGSVSLDASKKGINMSRIVRSFYDYKDHTFALDMLPKILRSYKKSVGSLEARLKVHFSYPLLQTSLRSGLEGYQYYKCSFEASIDREDIVRRFITFDFVYSSACPCSAELTEHARDVRGAYGIPHSQRSKARIRLEVSPGAKLTIEDIQAAALEALKTETQVMVKREDEQAFAELNGSYIKFVEDASRLLFAVFNRDRRIKDFEIACAHLESLHSHDAVAVICKGIPGGFKADFTDFGALIC